MALGLLNPQFRSTTTVSQSSVSISVGMAKSKSMTRNQNHSKKKVNTGDNGGVGPWSDLNHHLLYLVMMQLGVIDYLSFGCVCKSWRSLAISNRNTFMASKPAMAMRSYKKACYLEDFEGRKFKTILPHFAGRVFVGLTCGYLMFFRRTTRDFFLVNPITRHELSFPHFPINYSPGKHDVRAILVFSLSICGWVFVTMRKYSHEIWFSIAGKGAWNHVSSTFVFFDLHAFKGKIYIICKHLCELKLYPEPKLTIIETKNALKPPNIPQLVSSSENIYLMYRIPQYGYNYVMDDTFEERYMFDGLDFGEMKWVSREKTVGEYLSFLSDMKHGVAYKPELCESRGQGLLLGHSDGDMLKLLEVEKVDSFSANM